MYNDAPASPSVSRRSCAGLRATVQVMQGAQTSRAQGGFNGRQRRHGGDPWRPVVGQQWRVRAPRSAPARPAQGERRQALAEVSTRQAAARRDYSSLPQETTFREQLANT